MFSSRGSKLPIAPSGKRQLAAATGVQVTARLNLNLSLYLTQGRHSYPF